MVSKKDVLTFGLMAIGGVGIAMMVADGGSGGDGGGSGGVQQRYGRILTPFSGESPAVVKKGADVYYTTYNIKQPNVKFPEPQGGGGFREVFDSILAPAPPKDGGSGDSSGGGWEEAGWGIGTPDYVTPTTPTPIKPKIPTKKFPTAPDLPDAPERGSDEWWGVGY